MKQKARARPRLPSGHLQRPSASRPLADARCVDCAPVEKPKLTAIATSSLDGASFAARLDKAIERSKAPPQAIEHRPEETAPGVQQTGPLRDGR